MTEISNPIIIKDLGLLYPNKKSIRKRRYTLCKCFCGNEFKCRTDAINSNVAKSCGCKSDSL